MPLLFLTRLVLSGLSMLPAESDRKLDCPGYIGCRRIADTAKNRALNILTDSSLLQILDL